MAAHSVLVMFSSFVLIFQICFSLLLLTISNEVRIEAYTNSRTDCEVCSNSDKLMHFCYTCTFNVAAYWYICTIVSRYTFEAMNSKTKIGTTAQWLSSIRERDPDVRDISP
jgi:hypothetical protein